MGEIARRSCAAPRPAERGADACEQLVLPEGFADEVIGTELEPDHDVDLFAFS